MPLLSLAAALGLSCGVEPANGPAPPVRPQPTASMPAALRAAYLQARQNEAGPAHAFQSQRSAPATFAARNPVHDLEATLDPQGLRLRPARRADLPALTLNLQHYGCAAAPRRAAPTPPRLGPGPNRIEYPRAGVLEWYVNGPLGLEQGFTLDKDPGCADAGKLAFALVLGGEWEAALSGEGAAARVELRDPKDPKAPATFLYSDLFALDADGKELPSRMRLVGRTVRLEVDAAGARYPVTVDPAWTQQAFLVSLDGAVNDYFGVSVAVSGDTAVIGAPNKTVGLNARQGQAYVFVRSGTAWSPQALLMDSGTGAADDQFGMTVTVSGDTAVIGAGGKRVGPNNGQGQAYVFVRSGTMWSQQAILVDFRTGEAYDRFGSSVAVSGDTAVIGAPLKTVGPNNGQGQAYAFVQPTNPNGTPCTMGSQCTSTFCVDGLCCNLACGGGVFSDCLSCLGTRTGGSDGTCGAITRAVNYPCRAAVGICDRPELCDGLSESCPPDELYQPADLHLCHAATFCSRDIYCDGSTAYCQPPYCQPPKF